MTEVPITVKEVDQIVEDFEDTKNDVPGEEPDTRNPDAFTPWFVTLVLNIMFIVMHYANYVIGSGNDVSDYLAIYLFLVLGINLPWTLTCVRNYITIPNTPATRNFCIAFDVAVSKPFFRNHLVLLVLSVSGFWESSQFTIMLMDVVNNSILLQDIMKSITQPLPQLGIVFYLFVVTVIICELLSFASPVLLLGSDPRIYSRIIWNRCKLRYRLLPRRLPVR